MKSFGLPFLTVALSSLIATLSHAETIQAVIHLQERVPMETLALAVIDPVSSRFRSYYTPEEIRTLAGPADADYSALVQRLQREGAEIVRESPTHLFITVRADRSYLKTFSTARGFVKNVNGLEKTAVRKPHYILADQTVTRTHVSTFTGMTPDQIHSLYGFDAIYKAGFTGLGQHIAIASYDGFLLQDIQDYYAKNNLAPGPTVDQIVFNGDTTFNVGSAVETETDAEFSGMIAPGASIHVFASSQNNEAGELAMFTAILDDNRAQVVNYSWGSCESSLTKSHKADMDAVFARAVAQGVNILVASGDKGSDCEGDGTNSPDFPASHPDVVAVGGTHITDTTAMVLSETAWGDGTPTDGASGGGISTLYPTPFYQDGLESEQTMRGYPDVAFNADPQSGQPTWIHYDINTGQASQEANYVVIGGTSIAAPQWAGFLALIGEARGTDKPVGFLNPTFYGQSANQTKYFNDTSGGSNGLYTATVGWDAVTGYGSMQANALFNYLIQL